MSEWTTVATGGYQTVARAQGGNIEQPTLESMEADYNAGSFVNDGAAPAQVVTPQGISAGQRVEPNEALNYGIDADILAGVAGGKIADVLVGGSKVLKQGYNAAKKNRVDAYNKNIKDTGLANKQHTKDTNIVGTANEPWNIVEKPARAVVSKTPEAIKPPSLSLLTEVVGKLSPTAEEVLNKYWGKITAPVSKRAAIADEKLFLDELITSGVSRERANSILDKIYSNTTMKSAGKTLLDSVTKSPSKVGGVMGILTGQGQ